MAPGPIKPTIQQREASPSQDGQFVAARSGSPPRREPAGKLSEEAKAPANPQDADTQAFRPVVRPPMAILEILDDGSSDGERVRIRRDSITIGRTGADVVIPHDSQISALHARISRRLQGSAYEWYLTDLNSTNGTFLRVAKVTLVPGQLIVLGSHRYVFRGPEVKKPPEQEPTPPKGTRGWQAASALETTEARPKLVRLNPDGSERSFEITADDLLIGRAADRAKIVLDGDPAVSAAHARLRLNSDGSYILEDMKSVNGVWMAIDERRISKSVQFQVGEQRFCLRM
jgi:pSer/pThr/pTyr-binding forkhead associated (FHA) protein